MANRLSLRASDGDREVVIDRLREAAAEGRLLIVELEHRVEAALKARTYGELDALVADLPDPATSLPALRALSVPARRRPGMPLVAVATLALGVLLSSVAAVARSSFARLSAGGPGAGPPWLHDRVAGYHLGTAGLAAGAASMVMILSLVLTCVALVRLFANDSGEQQSNPS